MPNPNWPTPPSVLEEKIKQLKSLLADTRNELNNTNQGFAKFDKRIKELEKENKELRKYVEEANVAQEALDQRVEALETPKCD